MTSSPPTETSRLKFLNQKLTRRVTPLLIVALSVLMPQMASAGAWTLEKGQVWSKITVMSQSTDQHYNADGECSLTCPPTPATDRSRSISTFATA